VERPTTTERECPIRSAGWRGTGRRVPNAHARERTDKQQRTQCPAAEGCAGSFVVRELLLSETEFVRVTDYARARTFECLEYVSEPEAVRRRDTGARKIGTIENVDEQRRRNEIPFVYPLIQFTFMSHGRPRSCFFYRTIAATANRRRAVYLVQGRIR